MHNWAGGLNLVTESIFGRDPHKLKMQFHDQNRLPNLKRNSGTMTNPTVSVETADWLLLLSCFRGSRISVITDCLYVRARAQFLDNDGAYSMGFDHRGAFFQ